MSNQLPETPVDPMTNSPMAPKTRVASFMAIDPHDHGRIFAVGLPHDVLLAEVMLQAEGYVVVPRLEEIYDTGDLRVFALEEESAEASMRAGDLLLEKLGDLEASKLVYFYGWK